MENSKPHSDPPKTGQSTHTGHLPSSGRGLVISGWLTGIYFVIELSVGLWTGSIAVISDAFHTFSAVGGVIVAIVASRLSKRSADANNTFGWYRAEIVGALTNGAFLLIMAIVVIVMGAMRLGMPTELATGAMLWVAAGGLVTEVISIYLLFKQQGTDLNVRGAYWHILQTFIGSLIVILAALVIRYTGYLAIDPILGIAFGFVLLWASWGIIRDAVRILMDSTPSGIDLGVVAAALLNIKDVHDVHHVHSWALGSAQNVFSTHMRIAPESKRSKDEILKEAHALLRKDFGFFFSTIQIETECLDEKTAQTIDVVTPSVYK